MAGQGLLFRAGVVECRGRCDVGELGRERSTATIVFFYGRQALTTHSSWAYSAAR